MFNFRIGFAICAIASAIAIYYGVPITDPQATAPDFSVLLPETHKAFQYVDLGKLHIDQNPRLDTSSLEGQLKLLAIARAHNDSIATYGGFLEDRTELWNLYYPPKPGHPTWHLALDINNLDAGEPVGSLTDGILVDIYGDNVESNGWGGRVIVRSGDRFVLYGHLDRQSITLNIGSHVKRGQIIGRVGGSEINGHWFVHLHVQCMWFGFITTRYAGWYEDIDGYIQEKDTSQLARELIDPLTLML